MRLKPAIALMMLVICQDLWSIQDSSTLKVAPYTCNLARVDKLQAGSFLSVHSAPSASSRSIASLKPGAFVYIGDETRHWYKVFYGDAKIACGPDLPATGLDIRKATTCRSGWVSKEWITVISG
jgi:hypothetical protein